MTSKPTILRVLLTFILLFIITTSAAAQGTMTDLRVYQVDTTQCPLVRVRAAPLLGDGTVAGGLTKDAFRVYENSAERPVAELAAMPIGANIVIALDASSSINSPGATSKLRWEEGVTAVGELLLTDNWLEERVKRRDQVMIVGPQGDKDFRIVMPWSSDYQAVHNTAYLYEYKSSPLYTALNAIMVGAIEQLKRVPPPRFVLVLSDGIDRTSAEAIEDVINRANASGVTILSIKLGPPETGEAKSLERMARLTGGAFATYTGPASLKPLYSRVRGQRKQYELTYRSAVTRPGKHTVQLGVLWEKNETRSATTEFSVDIRPPDVKITEPVSGAEYKRIAPTWNADPKTISPREAPIAVAIAWPDSCPRTVQQVSYIVDGTVIETLPPDQPFVWDFSALPRGIHSLQAEAKDELGLVGRSDPVRISIDIVIPATPTPTPVPTSTPVPTPVGVIPVPGIGSVDLFRILPIILAAIAFILVLILFIRRPYILREGLERVGTGVKHVTDAWQRKGRKEAPSASVHASLIPMADDGTHGTPIPVKWSTTRLGFNPDECEITFNDSRVSKLHARIVREADGIYRIYDEMSKNGTYVNDEEVPSGGSRSLRSGDRVELGPIMLIFQISGRQPSDGEKSESGKEKGKDKTEPFSRPTR